MELETSGDWSPTFRLSLPSRSLFVLVAPALWLSETVPVSLSLFCSNLFLTGLDVPLILGLLGTCIFTFVSKCDNLYL